MPGPSSPDRRPGRTRGPRPAPTAGRAWAGPVHSGFADAGFAQPGFAQPGSRGPRYSPRRGALGPWEVTGYIFAGALVLLGLAMVAAFLLIVVQVNPQGNNK